MAFLVYRYNHFSQIINDYIFFPHMHKKNEPCLSQALYYMLNEH